MSEEVSPYSTPLPEGRLMSLDAFRGFVMFWIVGGEALAHALANLNGLQSEALDTVATQLKHVEWEGFRFYDLIFPSFVFIVGTSLVFSLRKLLAPGDRRDAVRRVIWRGLLLWLVGIIYYGGISKGWYDAGTNQGVRLLGVLQRIGICYLVTGLLFIYMPVRGLVAAFVILLGGYWALLSFVAVPGQGAVSFEEGRNITNWFDSKYLPFFKWKVTHDPEGILSTFPAVATCLLRGFCGLAFEERADGPGQQGFDSGGGWGGFDLRGEFLGRVSSGDQESVDFQFRGAGGRMEFGFIVLLLFGDGCGESEDVGDAIGMDRDESDYDLSAVERG
jgi:predicted acyltransferase